MKSGIHNLYQWFYQNIRKPCVKFTLYRQAYYRFIVNETDSPMAEFRCGYNANNDTSTFISNSTSIDYQCFGRWQLDPPSPQKHCAACLKVPDDFPGQTPAFHQSQERPTLAFIYSTDQPPTLKSSPKMHCFVQYIPVSLLNLSLPALPKMALTFLGEGRVNITATVDAENTARGLRMESVS